MGLENTLFEGEGSVSFGLTYMTGALVKIGQGLATMISGGPRLDWVPYLVAMAGPDQWRCGWRADVWHLRI